MSSPAYSHIKALCDFSIMGKTRQWNIIESVRVTFVQSHNTIVWFDYFRRRRRMSRHPLQSAQRRTHQPNEVLIVTRPLEDTTALWTSGTTRWKRTCVKRSRHPLQSAQRRTHQPNEVLIVTRPLEDTTALWTSGTTRWKRTCVKRLVKKFCGT